MSWTDDGKGVVFSRIADFWVIGPLMGRDLSTVQRFVDHLRKVGFNWMNNEQTIFGHERFFKGNKDEVNRIWGLRSRHVTPEEVAEIGNIRGERGRTKPFAVKLHEFLQDPTSKNSGDKPSI